MQSENLYGEEIWWRRCDSSEETADLVIVEHVCWLDSHLINLFDTLLSF
jgi:hypothetical protein